MKLEKSFLFLAIMACTLLFASCNKNDGFDIDDDDTNLEVGIHKYVIEVTGNDEVMQVISIAGNTPTAIAKLYDENGEYLGESFTDITTVGKRKRMVCKTGNNGENLTLVYSLLGNDTDKAHVKITSFIGKKQVHNIEKELDAAGDTFHYNVTLQTASY